MKTMREVEQRILSEAEETIFADPARVRQLNQSLAAARTLVPPISYDGLTFSIHYLHFGNGPFPKGSGASRHCHQRLQIEYVVSGRFVFRGEGRTFEMESGDGLLIPPSVYHEWESLETGVMLGVLIETQQEKGADLLTALRHTAESPFVSFSGPDLQDQFHELFALLAALEVTLWKVERLSFLLGTWFTQTIARGIDFKRERVNFENENRREKICRQVHDFLKANFALDIQLSDVALEVGLSARHLNRIMKQVHGETVGEALLRIRLEAAQRMLVTERELPVKAVAYQCGFNYPAYFTARFRKHFGMNPSDCR